MNASYTVIKQADIASSNLIHAHAQEQLFELQNSANCFLTVLSDCMVGSFVVLDKADLLNPGESFTFQLDKDMLVLVDEKKLTSETLHQINKTFEGKMLTPAHLLFMLIRLFTKDDSAFLAQLEDELESLEEKIVENNNKINNRTMLVTRRKIFKLSTFYEQLADMVDVFTEDQMRIIDDADQTMFRLFSQQLDRLTSHAKSLREYNLQLYELYQMQVDTQLNKTMRLLTVIATIFMPLTFITSWYGMNFEGIDEFKWEYGYIVVIGVCIVIFIAELIYFKKKKWL